MHQLHRRRRHRRRRHGRKLRFTRGGILWLAIIGLASIGFFFPSLIPDPRGFFSASTPSPTPSPADTPPPAVTPTPTPAPAVRVIYATPSDREFNPAYAQGVEGAIYHVQQWYSDKLGGYTFMVEPPVPQHCTLENQADYYAREHGWDRIMRDLQHCAPVEWSSSRYVWVIYPDVPFDCEHSTLGAGGGGITILHRGDLDGLISPLTYVMCGQPPRGRHGWAGGLAHEIGHAFGLLHPPGCDWGYEGPEICDEDNVMAGGFYYDYPDTNLTEADVATLLASPFFQSHQWEE